MLRNMVLVFATLVVFTGVAAAQSFPLGPRAASRDEIEKQKAEEGAYRRAMEKVPEKEKKSTDPWGNVRQAPQTAEKKQRH